MSLHNPLARRSEEDQRVVRKRENDLKIINREITQVRMEMETDKRQLLKNEQCNNLSLIQKMSSMIISSYMAHFDEIFNLLIEDILEE
jgi:hypothetical protein